MAGRRPAAEPVGGLSSSSRDRVTDARAETDVGWRTVLTGRLGALTIGLTLLTLSVATESLVITTIMPAIVKDIGGLSLYGVAFSAFFLAGLVSIPIAGWAIDRYGPAAPFAVTIGVFIVGTGLAALAPTMPVLVLGRTLQGFGASAQFTISQSTIAGSYPGRARIRVLSLMSATWTIPGLIGPAVGAAITSLFGWRWAFGVVVAPALLAIAITLPQLMKIGAAGNHVRRPPILNPLAVAAGVGLLLVGLTSPSILTVALAAIGAAVAARSLTRILPARTVLAAPGLPAIVAASFFLNFSYYAAASFIALALVGVRATTVFVAGVAITANTIAWTVGVWANTILLDRFSRRTLITVSAAGLGLSVGAFASSLYVGPLWIAFVTWTIGGFCMGIAFNTLTLNTMDAAATRAAGQALAGRNLSANLGTAVGTGIAGSAVALTQTAGFGLTAGLLVAYAMAAAAGLVTAALGTRASAAADSVPVEVR